jgi:hypothetical protein
MNHTEKPHPLEPELVTTGGARSLDDTQTRSSTAATSTQLAASSID